MRSDEKARLAASIQQRVIKTITPNLNEDESFKLAKLVVEVTLACSPTFTRNEVEEVVRRGFYNSL
jgi:ornithine cyclodeaminase/alanine dehydrogenase-like protein (mu-crystallin family)